MADLLDIAPSTSCEAVKIDGQRFVVRGLNGNAVASIAVRFPDIIRLLVGGGVAGVDIGTIIARCGIAFAPIIAAGFGHLGDEKYEQRAGELLFDDQLKLVTAIIGLSFPNGFTAIVEVFTAVADKPKPVKMRLRKSPSASPSLSEKDSRPTMQ